MNKLEIMSIGRIEETDNVVLNLIVEGEMLPFYVSSKKWERIKQANGVDDVQDEVLVHGHIETVTYQIVRKDEKWKSEYRGTEGVYKADKIRIDGNILVSANVQAAITYYKNRALFSAVEEKVKTRVEASIADELNAMLDFNNM